TMPQCKPICWREATVNPSTEARLAALFDCLLQLGPAADEHGHPTPFALPLTPEAKRAWVQFYDRHRCEMADLDDDLAAAWSKLEAYCARFALIIQLCAWADGVASADCIDQASIEAGIALADWFGAEARRVYGILFEADGERETRELVELIRRKGNVIT